MLSVEQLISETVTWLGVEKIHTHTDQVEKAAKATIEYVNSLPHIDKTPTGEWAETTKLGAIMYCGRLSLRFMSPNGIEEVSLNGVAYVSKYDSDIDRLLNIGQYAKPILG